MFQYFYHQRVRKSVALFGTLFNNIYVLRKDKTGRTISQVKVPLAYAPKDKYLERIRTSPLSGETRIALKLPRMSFEITSISYDPEKRLPKSNNFHRSKDNNHRHKFSTPSPYLMGFQLNIYAKNQDDALQMVEQILPYFNPAYTITIKPFSNDHANIVEDVPVTIQGVNFSDDFEGSVEDRRTIIYTLDFTMSVQFYGPINDQNIIRKTITTTFDLDTGNESLDAQLQKITMDPNPLNVNPDSDFGFTTTIQEDFNAIDLSGVYVAPDYVDPGYVDSSGAT